MGVFNGTFLFGGKAIYKAKLHCACAFFVGRINFVLNLVAFFYMTVSALYAERLRYVAHDLERRPFIVGEDGLPGLFFCFALLFGYSWKSKGDKNKQDRFVQSTKCAQRGVLSAEWYYRWVKIERLGPYSQGVSRALRYPRVR